MEHPRRDDKDWRWVLERPCPECGFDASSVDRDDLGPQVRSNAAAWRALLSRGAAVKVRPPSGPDRGPVWSALEYGAHVRDVYDLFQRRINEMLRHDNPTFAEWDQDQAAIDRGYRDEDPDRVSYRLAVTAGQVADVLDRLRPDQWARTGQRSDGASFTVASIAAYLLHDATHHLHDAEQGLDAIAEAG